jgi:hypothetical protein
MPQHPVPKTQTPEYASFSKEEDPNGMVPHAVQYEALQLQQVQQYLYSVNDPKYYGGSPQERESAYLYLCYNRTYLSIEKKKITQVTIQVHP